MLAVLFHPALVPKILMHDPIDLVVPIIGVRSCPNALDNLGVSS